jgi:hypothetical protein
MRLKKVLLVSLMMISYTSTLMAQENLSKDLNDYYSKPTVKGALAEVIKEVYKCHSQLHITEQYLDVCQAMDKPTIQWFQEPTVIIGGMAVSFSLGVLVVATKCFGICK